MYRRITWGVPQHSIYVWHSHKKRKDQQSARASILSFRFL